MLCPELCPSADAIRLEVGCAELCLELFKWREILNFYAFCVLGDQQPLLPSVSSNDLASLFVDSLRCVLRL